MEHLVEALHCKLRGCTVHSRWNHWDFSLTNPSGHTVVLGLAQLLTEISTGSLSWVLRVASAYG
jgi:hypothetical protein